MEIKEICALIDERKEELFQILSNLIKINSENFSTHGNEAECAKYIYDLCKEMGLEADMYSPLDIEGFKEHPDYLEGRGLENRYNTVARLRGEEDIDEVMIMSHSDTVLIGDLANWKKDPLSGEIADGRIYGRGASDDKYGIATALFIMKLLKEKGVNLKKNLLFAAYSDEEYGGSHGAMAAVMKYPCNRIVSMDCADEELWHCGSGGGEAKYFFHIDGALDSAKQTAKGISVIMECMEKFARNRYDELENNRFYKGTEVPASSLRYMGVKAGNNGMDLGYGEVYFVFYTDKTKEEIFAEFDELHKEIAEKLAPLGIIGDGFKMQTRFFHYVWCEPDSEDIRIMLESARETTGKEPAVCASCLSDLSVISKHGSDKAFGFGIGRAFTMDGGSHQPNEFIECDRLVEFTKTIAAYILKVLG